MDSPNRKALLKELRQGAWDRKDPIGFLIGSVESKDASVEKAALVGLLRHDDHRALCGLAGRLLIPRGVAVIRSCINLLGHSEKKGSIVVLSATLFLDGRYIVEKFKALEIAMESLGDMISLSLLATLRRNEEIFSSPGDSLEIFETIRSVPNRDMSAGAVFGSAFQGVWGEYQGALPLPDLEDFILAEQYIRTQIPGLVEVFRERLDARDEK